MKTFKEFINESVRDYLKPKSEEEIIRQLGDSNNVDRIKYILKNKLNPKYLPKGNLQEPIIEKIKFHIKLKSGGIKRVRLSKVVLNDIDSVFKDNQKHHRIKYVDYNGLHIEPYKFLKIKGIKKKYYYKGTTRSEYDIPYEDLSIGALLNIIELINNGISGDWHFIFYNYLTKSFPTNESIKDYLKSKSKEEIEQVIKNMDDFDKIKYIKRYNLPKIYMPSYDEVKKSSLTPIKDNWMTFKKLPPDPNAGFNVGSFKATYNELVKLFGKPYKSPKDINSKNYFNQINDFYWNFQDINGRNIKIFNHKRYNKIKDIDKHPNTMVRWEVAAYQTSYFDYIEKYINSILNDIRKTNESVKNYLQPKSEKEIEQAIKNMPNIEKFVLANDNKFPKEYLPEESDEIRNEIIDYIKNFVGKDLLEWEIYVESEENENRISLDHLVSDILIDGVIVKVIKMDINEDIVKTYKLDYDRLSFYTLVEIAENLYYQFDE